MSLIAEASCRRGFYSTLFEGDFLQVRGQLPSGGRGLVMVHGYKNDYFDARDAYEEISQRGKAAGLPYEWYVGFYWPGSMFNVGFFRAGHRANESGLMLREFLMQLRYRGCRTDVETHSLGARVALSSLHQAKLAQHLILTAPAVDDDAFLRGKEFVDVPGLVDDILVFHSSGDNVLKYAYRASELIFFSGCKAMGLGGSKGEFVNVHDVNCDAYIHGHGEYKKSDYVFEKWSQLV